jgi:hypothetical protein
VSQSPAGADRQSVVQFMTTEHFTLQTARTVANAEISARLQLYMTTLSSAIIALALVAQLSELGRAFVGFALVLLPVVYLLEVAPEMAPYFVLPATDDPWASLAAIGIRGRGWWQGLLTTALAMVLVVNSVLAGVFAGLVGGAAGPSGPVVPAVAAAAGFTLSMLVLGAYEQRTFRREMAAVPVAFPSDRAAAD